MKSLIYLFGICLMSLQAFTQVKIGDNHTTVNENSLLELESASKGFLLPRITLTSTTSASPLTSHVQGMMIFNTATTGSGATAVTPGIYYNNGTQWEKMEITSNITPVATIISSANPNTPNGYLYCNGQAVSRTTYASLFAIIGTTYGAGDGSTTFNLPDYRGYFLRGQNDASGNDPDAASRTNSGNGTTGDNLGTKQTGQVQSHNHIDGKYIYADGFGQTRYGVDSSPGYQYVNGNTTTTFDASSPYTSNTGGNETRPKNITVKYYIKY
jgi:microcystin-dependent protein